ncbi:MAG: nucleotide exchange factor GrpE [Gammaproteobacteria bacterium]|nr:nucleotide exchange factor GrpE [Gammaproteobacteria bacterium]MCF6229591.1 nucleotide exchange factor GrpE [Gammaproteobacteria bacterium]
MSNKKKHTDEQPESIEGVIEPSMDSDPSEAETNDLDVAGLQQALLAAEEKANNHYELALRTKAEAENLKRRADQDVAKARKFALDKFVDSLIPVLDSLDMSLQAATGSDESVVKLREGNEMTLKMFLDALQKNGVQQINPEGELFNPQLHEAMSMQESTEHAPNSVMVVFQKGYALNDRLIRPARVVVAKAAVAAEDPVGGKIDEQA